MPEGYKGNEKRIDPPDGWFKPGELVQGHNTGLLNEWSSDNSRTHGLALEEIRKKWPKHVYESRKEIIRSYGDIQYYINKQGFRTDEFDEIRDVLIIGCSITAGVGVHEHQMFSNNWCREKGLSFYNLGITGGGFETMYRMLHDYMDILKPRIVLCNYPYTDARREVRLEDRCVIFSPKHIMDNQRNRDFPWMPVLFGEKEININRERMLDAIRWRCYNRNVKLIEFADVNTMESDFQARDLHHPSGEQHASLLTSLLSKTKDEIL